MKKHPADIYISGTDNRVYSPFKMVIDPMDRLLLINFEKDPDTVYLGFEPQVFDDAIHGKGLLVIGWRVDGRVDVYHQPSLQLEKDTYDITGKGLADMVERHMEESLFEIGERGVQVNIRFKDKTGRRVQLQISESHPKKREPFGLLAPMGQAAEKPSAMPLVLLHDFYFVRKKHTLIEIKIGEKIHQPDSLPLPLDWTSMYFSRYSPDPLILTLNPAQDSALESMEIQENDRGHLNKNQYKLERNGDKMEIAMISVLYQHHQVNLEFSPVFPQVQFLNFGAQVRGIFTITGHPSTGKISGVYHVSRDKTKGIQVMLHPSGGWQPNEKKLSLRFLYFVAGIFKNWPKTYMWKAQIHEKENGWHMRSKWERLIK